MKLNELGLDEAAYPGNIGAMEMFRFQREASDEQKSRMKALLSKKQNKEAWEYMQQVLGVKLHGA